MQHDSAPLVNAYAAIEDLLKEVQGYVKVNVHKMADHNICTVLVYVHVHKTFFIDVQSVRIATCTPACFGTKVLASISPGENVGENTRTICENYVLFSHAISSNRGHFSPFRRLYSRISRARAVTRAIR